MSFYYYLWGVVGGWVGGEGGADVVAPRDVVASDVWMVRDFMKKEKNQGKVESNSADRTYNVGVIRLSVEMSYYTYWWP